jgi:capsid protein
VDRAYRDYFYSWCTRADLTGRHRLRELVELALKAMLRDGDFGFVKVKAGREIRLQSVEADRIGNPLEAAGANSETYIRGITINGLGQPTSYRIFNRTRNGQYTLDREVMPQQFLHLMKARSTDQYRPESWLAPALPDARDLYEMVGFEKQAAKFASMFSGFLKPKDPFGRVGGSAWDTAPKGGELGVINATAGQIRQLPADYGDVVFAPGTQRPSGAFIQLFETMIRSFSNALVVPYGFVWDMAVFGGVTARIETMQVDRCFERYRQLLVDRCLEAVKDDVLSTGISFKEIPPTPNWRAGKWNFGAKLTGDVGHDTSANVQKLQMGLATQTNLLDYDGEEFEDVTETQAKEMQFKQQMAAKYKIPIELLDQRFPQATALLAAMNTPPPPPPPGIVAQEGGAGEVKPLLAILEQVGEGTMEHDAGVQSLVALYGIAPALAEKMVPKGPPPARRYGQVPEPSGSTKADGTKKKKK